jgi:putative transposase
MSRRGNCYDNAPIESFLGEKHCFARKNELVYHKAYETREDAIKDVTRYIEIFYNRQRIQKGLGFRSPAGVSETFTVRLPDQIYQVFYSVFDSMGQACECRYS